MNAPQPPGEAPATDPITTHALDQTIGRPGEGIRARLELLPASESATPDAKSPPGPTGKCFYADTAIGSGRVGRWYHLPSDPLEVAQIPVGEIEKHEDGLRIQNIFDDLRRVNTMQSTWVLRLETGQYWKQRGIPTFYPFVEVHFKVDFEEGRNHWHVPFLLGPHGFTTYRGT